MKLSQLFQDSDTRPFRFAIILAAILISLLVSSSADSQDTGGQIGWTTSYDEALELASKQNAPLMLCFVGSDWCPWSQKLMKEVFETAEFAAWADAKLVPVIVDFPRQHALPANLTTQNNNLLNRYRPHLTGFPTALFIRPDGTVIGKLGYEKRGVLFWIHEAQKIVGKLDKIAMLDLTIHYPENSDTMTVMFCPPKPKLLFRA